MRIYQSILNYLYSFIPQKRLLFTGENGILRTKYLLRLLGNPQEKIKVVHIAGTSGKGSTAYLISALLKAHGFTTGLQVSPHLLDIRERFQLNNQLIQKEKFTQYLAGIMPYIEQAKETKWGKLSFFEIGVCLAFYIFRKEKVDFAVMETGLGGLYDGTNVVENPGKTAVITRIGIDHQKVLGNSLSSISTQKAGIIKKGNMVITVQQNPSVMEVLYRSQKSMSSVIYRIQKNRNFKIRRVTGASTVFDYEYKDLKLAKIYLGLIGEHQAENTSLALTVLYELGKRYGFSIKENIIRSVLKKASFKGRFEILSTRHRDIIIDGAHNPQKMKAFINTLKQVFPDRKYDFIISFSEGKNQLPTMRNMLKMIIPITCKLYITDFILEGDDVLHTSVNQRTIAGILDGLGFKDYSILRGDTQMLDNIIKRSSKPLVITGSLYLIGSIYQKLMKIKSKP